MITKKGNVYGPTVEVGNLHGGVRKIAMNHVVKQKLIWLIPACLCVLIFFLIHLIQKIGTFIIPGWGVVVLSIFFGAIIFSYSVRLCLLNRIGGEKFYFWLPSSLSACWYLIQPLINTLNKHP